MKANLFTVLLLVFSICIHAATYTVTNTNDSGTGSLRQAIDDANAVGPDMIEFNIPLTDPNYNATTGVFTITLLSDLPYLLTGSTTINGSSQSVNIGDTNPVGPEIFIDGTNTISSGLIIPSPNNIIYELILGNFTYGINIYGSMATNNTISHCYIGVDGTGIAKISNDVGITVSDGAEYNTITNSLISGNLSAGIGISMGGNNTIQLCAIGTNYDASDSLPNGSGIIILGSSYNSIGNGDPAYRNYISGNYDSGIIIEGSSEYNEVVSNYIGTDLYGSSKIPNGFGISIINAGLNRIGGNSPDERNLISGNIECGVLINGTGAEENHVTGNYIGVDATGLNILDNHVGVIIKTNADKNYIGGTDPGELNVISGNSEIGVYIESADSNIVVNNYIGPDATGAGMLMDGDTLFQANGIELNTVAMYNVIGGYLPEERNIISGNRVYGMIYYGQTSENYLIGNYIGTDVTGTVAMRNATGICVDASSNHNYIFNNVLSGNVSYGIFLVTTGTYFNEVKGNLIGTNAEGTDSIPNDIGLLLSGGAQNNIIGGETPGERNIISGNRYNGIEIADNTTNFNQIINNYVGTDKTGTYAIPNGNGVGFSSYPKNNVVDGNLISGNNETGLILYEYSDSNTVVNNYIGTDNTGANALGNGLGGVIIATGSSYNNIGGDGEGNIIAFNDSAGIIVLDDNCLFNIFSQNSIFENSLPGGIEIFPFGHNPNDAGDTDIGANELMNCPVITDAYYYDVTGHTHIYGTIDTEDPENVTIEIFVAEPDGTGYGQGKLYLGNTNPDATGYWSRSFPGVVVDDEITATATNANGSTSEYAQNFSVIVGKEELEKNEVKVWPNPASDKINILSNDPVLVELFDMSGRNILMKNNKLSGYSRIDISDLPTGVYALKITGEEGIMMFKVIKN